MHWLPIAASSSRRSIVPCLRSCIAAFISVTSVPCQACTTPTFHSAAEMVSAEAILATCVFLVDVPLMLGQFWVFYQHSNSRKPLYIWLGCLFVAIGTEATPLGLLWYELESGGELGLPVGVLAELVILAALWWRILTEVRSGHHHSCNEANIADPGTILLFPFLCAQGT